MKCFDLQGKFRLLVMLLICVVLRRADPLNLISNRCGKPQLLDRLGKHVDNQIVASVFRKTERQKLECVDFSSWAEVNTRAIFDKGECCKCGQSRRVDVGKGGCQEESEAIGGNSAKVNHKCKSDGKRVLRLKVWFSESLTAWLLVVGGCLWGKQASGSVI